MITRAFASASAMGQQAVNARDSDVVNVLNVVAHHFRGDDSFFGDGDVAGSRRDDHDHALAVLLAITLEHDGASQWTILRAVCVVAHAAATAAYCSSVARVASTLPPWAARRAKDFGDLAGRFALGKNHLGHTVAQGAMVIDLGETQVLEGQVTQALDGVVGGEALFANLLEELAKGLGVHRCELHCRLPGGFAESSVARSTTESTGEHRGER